MISPQPQEPQPDPKTASELHAMGLSSDPLRAAILDGHNTASRRTSNDVVTGAGFDRWAIPLRSLGDHYAGKGFERMRPGGFEILRSPDESFDIAVARGTFATGLEDRMPSTRVERGPLTEQAVGRNRHQLSLGQAIPSIGGISRPLTWLLLHFFDAHANELRVELSVPVEFTRSAEIGHERGAVTFFEPRLFLPSIPLADNAKIEDDDEGDDDIEIPVGRRR